MPFIDFIILMFKQGLGELFVLHRTENQVYLGNLVYEKGKLIVRDMGFLPDMKPTQLTPCWESGTLGLICSAKGYEWESLTFYGLKECDLSIDLSATCHGALIAAENQYGDKLIDFVGSVYRGYQLMLDNHFLPVVLLNEVRTKKGERGLMVTDLRSAPMEISVIREVNDAVRDSIKKYLFLNVEDIKVDPEYFKQLFKDYLPNG